MFCNISRSAWFGLLMAACTLLATSAQAAGTVGGGTPASCTEAALDAALVGGGVVTFNCGAAPASIFFTGGKTISADTDIDGGGLITLDGNGQTFTLFQVVDGIDFSISGLTLRDAGGAVWTNTGNLHIDGCTISDHDGIFFKGAVSGGGILDIAQSVIKRNTYTSGSPGAGITSFGNGTLTITDSEISGNVQLTGGGAGLYISSDGALIANSTFSGNDATGSNGGGLRNDGTGTVIVNSTFTGNSANVGGAIEAIAGSLEIIYSTIAGNIGAGLDNQQAGIILTLADTIVANNDFNCNGTFTDGGNNLQFGGGLPTSCGGTIPAADPLLDILDNNGGPTRTMALLPGSPARDAGNNSTCPLTDQRGISRPQGPACDIGAFEAQSASQPSGPKAIPTLGYRGMVGLALLLAFAGLAVIRFRSHV